MIILYISTRKGFQTKHNSENFIKIRPQIAEIRAVKLEASSRQENNFKSVQVRNKKNPTPEFSVLFAS